MNQLLIGENLKNWQTCSKQQHKCAALHWVQGFTGHRIEECSTDVTISGLGTHQISTNVQRVRTKRISGDFSFKSCWDPSTNWAHSKWVVFHPPPPPSLWHVKVPRLPHHTWLKISYSKSVPDELDLTECLPPQLLLVLHYSYQLLSTCEFLDIYVVLSSFPWCEFFQAHFEQGEHFTLNMFQ